MSSGIATFHLSRPTARTTHPSVTDLLSLVDNCEASFDNHKHLVIYGGHVTHINDNLSSLATFAMCTLYLPQ
jgi:hypothetical protein